MKIYIYLLLLVLAMSCVCVRAQDVQYCEDTYKNAENAFRKKDYKKAKKYYLQVVRECSDKYADCKHKIFLCNEELTPHLPNFRLARTLYTCDATEDIVEITFVETPERWHVQSKPSWVQQDKKVSKKDKSVTFFVRENNSIESRKGYIEFASSDGSANAKVLITQSGKKIIFNSERKNISFSEYGGSELVQVNSNCSWGVSNYSEWLRVQQLGENLLVSCGINHHPSIREGDIILVSEYSQELRIPVTQDMTSDYLQLSACYIENFKGTNATYFISVSSNKPWQINNKPNWCNIAINQDTLVITLTQNKTGNTRKGEIDVISTQSEYLRRVISIEQAPMQQYLIIKPEIITEQDGDGGIATISVDTDCDNYHVEGMPNWCKVKRQDATSFTIEISDNSGGEARTAQCYVVGEDRKATLTIKQGAKLNYLNISPQIIRSSKSGGVITVRVKSNGVWSIVNLPSWCQVYDQNEDSFGLRILRNEYNAREATFSVSSHGRKENIIVKQE